MKYYDWDGKKNKDLKKERDISFEDIVNAISEGNLLDTVNHPNKKRYPNQKQFMIKINEYVYIVPFIDRNGDYFLKTIIPSRKATKKYLFSNK